MFLIMKEFLTKIDREVLKKQHRQEKNRLVADRIKAILLSDKSWTYCQIAEALLIDGQTWMQSGELVNHLERITYLKISDIIVYVQGTYGVSYRVQGMTSWMYAHGFYFKKPKGTLAKADPLKQKV